MMIACPACLSHTGPGSGKTRIVVARVIQLLQQGVAPQSILVITFTRKVIRVQQVLLGTALAASGPRSESSN